MYPTQVMIDVALLVIQTKGYIVKQTSKYV